MSGAQDMILLGNRLGESANRDNLVASAVLTGIPAQTHSVLGFFADYSAAVSAIKAITFKQGVAPLDANGSPIKSGPIDPITLARGSTDRNVSSTAFQYQIDTAGTTTAYGKAAVTAGTALSAGTIPINQWGAYLLSINAAGTIAVTGAPANGTTGYATEAAAIAALPALPVGSALMGYVTVKTAVGTTFVAGTDALAGGASGNVASATNYYPQTPLAGASPVNMCRPLRWDFAKGPCWIGLPGILKAQQGYAIQVDLEGRGTGGTSGQLTVFAFTK